ncbi:MAG: SDR family NAD(P)-dependent oxidoreductase [Planctomycetota bacterium]|nr:SDR family NAD(P)-dependent oxidoreductase [Planctomycetota bacterium]
MRSTSDNPMRAHYAGRRVCVTGGAGFIGSHLAEALLLLGADVVLLDDLSASDGAHAAALVESYPRMARLVFGSILDPAALREALTGVDTVFHLAAMNSVPRSIAEPERTFEVNAVGTVRIVEECRRRGARRIVYAASSSAYGDGPEMPKVEGLLPRPQSPYASSKLAGESVLRAWAHSYGLSAVSLRYFNVFGPRQSADNAYAAVVAAFLAKLHAGEHPAIFGDGSASRDFTPVANVVQATLLAGASPKDLKGEVVNVGTGRRTTVVELAHLLARLAGRPDLTPVFRDPRPGDVAHSLADISLAHALLGYDPVKSLEDGLADTAAWFARSSREPLATK